MKTIQSAKCCEYAISNQNRELWTIATHATVQHVAPGCLKQKYNQKYKAILAEIEGYQLKDSEISKSSWRIRYFL